MPANPPLETVEKIWYTWEIQVFVLLSLLLQTILIFLAPLRKRSSQMLLNSFIWIAYILADNIAIFALGLISKSQLKPSSNNKKNDLQALWAPFLLLHLGGPDTITAFALEDNELWLRHLINLLSQSFLVGNILFQSFPHNKLWLPMSFMIVAGLIKYLERNRALFGARLKSFRGSMLPKPDPGPNYAKLMDEYAWKKESGLPTEIEMINEPELDKERNTYIEEGSNHTVLITDLVMVQKAYDFFNTFKGLIVDLIFSFHEREKSRNFFLRITEAKSAFRVIEIELNFIYDVLYTKAPVIYSLFTYLLRALCFILTLISLFLFKSSKEEFNEIDIKVTYTLFIAALCLDVIAFFMLIFSDWTIALLKNGRCVTSFVSLTPIKYLFFNKTRWSGCVPMFNLMKFCLRNRPQWVEKAADLLAFKDLLNEIQFKSLEPLSNELKEFIFNQVKQKAERAKDLKTAKQICSSRGELVLGDNPRARHLLGWSFEVEYDESLLLWHIATDLLYHEEDDNTHDHRKFCKVLSDYILYLLVMQPIIISSISSIAQMRYRDTCAEAEKFFGRLVLEQNKSISKEARRRLLDVKAMVKPAAVKGDRSKSVLFDAVILAGNLRDLKDEKWNIMILVWVDLLCYAASHCRPDTHVRQLTKGGELVTLLWLLMVQFGLGEQFLIEAGHGRAKLVVKK